MKKSVFMAIGLAVSLLATAGLSATEYNIFVHGRSSDDLCSQAGGNVDPHGSPYQRQVTYDGNAGPGSYRSGYWGVSSYTDHAYYYLPNVRYVNWRGGTANPGGAWDWGTCGARLQAWHTLYLLCRNGNVCNIYTHSTGSLVIQTLIAHHGGDIAAHGIRINRIHYMSSAAGGSELANYSNAIRAGSRYSTAIMALSYWGDLNSTKGTDASVATYAARNDWTGKYSNYGYMFYTSSGDGWTSYGGVTGPLLPGRDDSVVANHSLCNVNTDSESVDAVCGMGTSSFRHRYRKWKSWRYVTRYEYYYRWPNYYTVYQNGSDHTQGRKYWRKALGY